MLFRSVCKIVNFNDIEKSIENVDLRSKAHLSKMRNGSIEPNGRVEFALPVENETNAA